MMIYKLFRYLFFVCYLLILIFFFVPMQDRPAILNNIYDPIMQYFSSNEKIDLEKYEERVSYFQDLEQKLFATQYNLISLMENNLAFAPSLELAKDRNFDDFSYLIQTFLSFAQYFEDVILYHNDDFVFKYDNAYRPDYFAFRKTYQINNQEFAIDYIFNSDLLEESVKKIKIPLVLSFDNQLYMSDPSIISNQLLINSIFSYNWSAKEEFAMISSVKPYQLVAYRNLTQFNKALEIYIPQKISISDRGMKIFLFILLVIFVHVILFSLDFWIKKKIRQVSLHSFKKPKDTREEDMDSHLSWLEGFIKIESHLDEPKHTKNTPPKKKKQENTENE